MRNKASHMNSPPPSGRQLSIAFHSQAWKALQYLSSSLSHYTPTSDLLAALWKGQSLVLQGLPGNARVNSVNQQRGHKARDSFDTDSERDCHKCLSPQQCRPHQTCFVLCLSFSVVFSRGYNMNYFCSEGQTDSGRHDEAMPEPG